VTARIAERLRFESDRTVTVLSGKVELGQGLSDALTLICSEELALPPERIRVLHGDTGTTPNDGLTAGSGSMERTGSAVRSAARATRLELIRRASERLGVSQDRLTAYGGAVCRRAEDGDRVPDRAHGGTTDAKVILPSHRDSPAPESGATANGGGVDYWELLSDAELGDGRIQGSALAPAPIPDSKEDARPAAGPGTGRPVATPSASHDASAEAPHGGLRTLSWRRVDRVVRGGGNFVHDLRLPEMVHGRVLRPPGYGHRLISMAADAARAMDGVVAVVVDGSFVAVAAQREEQAIAACEVLAASARWQPPEQDGLPPDGYRGLCEAPVKPAPILRRGGPAEPRARNPSPPDRRLDTPGAEPPSAVREAPSATVKASYSRPFLMHGSLGPSAAAARLDRDGGLTVWSHTQGPFELRGALAEALQRAPETIRVIHVDGAGCYGHNGADDVALDAVLLALAVPERPVLVQWTREDEHRWEPYGTAMTVTCSADLDAAGSVTRWRHDVRSHAHSTRPRATPGHSTLLAAWHRAAPLTPPPPRNGTDLTAGPQRNAEPLYDFRELEINTHFVPEAPVRVSALRSLGAFANVFAIESFMDELAARTGEDPLAYRLRHLRDERARRVLAEAVRAAPAAATQAAHAPAPRPAESSARSAYSSADAAAIGDAVNAQADAGGAPVRHADGSTLLGRGMAVARYKNLQAWVAVVCDVAVHPGSGQIRLLHAAIAADAGRIIDRDGLANQLEGGFLQAASWTLKEEVRWDRAAIRSTDWDSYPVLRFSEVPPVTVRLIDRPDLPSVGAGEASQGPTPAAIANAVYAAAGIRLRHTPFTPARVMAALAAAVR
jgi:CO/xanthine dehydrogenase Mo-binding subunit